MPDHSDKQPSLRNRTLIGLAWSGIGRFGSQGIHYVVLLSLAWLLSPADFGLAGLVIIYVLFIQAVGELGLASAVIQQPNITPLILDTAFWANFAVSILMAMATYVSAEWIAAFLGDVSAAPMLKVMALVFPVTALGVVPMALLEKNLDFRKIFWRDMGSEIAFGLVGLSLAIAGFGAWSLLGAAIAHRIATLIVLWYLLPWRPNFKFNWQEFNILFRFGLSSMMARILDQSIANVDYFVVGRWFGVEALGYYTLAFQLAVIPAQRLLDMLRRVAFPSFSLVQNDAKRLKKGFIESVQHLFAVLAPLSFFLIVLAPWFIETVYGEKWLPAVLPLQILAVSGFFYGFDITQALYFAVGKPQVRVWVTVLRLALFFVIAFGFGYVYGIAGIALSMTLAVILTSFPGFLAVAWLTNSSVIELLRPIWPAVRGVLWAAIPVALMLITPLPPVPAWLMGLALGIIMTAIYGLALVPTYRSLLEQLSDGLLRVLSK